MPIAVAPSLFLGLGARILLEQLFYPKLVSSTSDHVFSGVWQGVGLYYLLMEFPPLLLPALILMGGKLFYQYTNWGSDVNKCASTVLGVAIGVLFTDVLSQFIEDDWSSSDRHSSSRKAKSRLVQLRSYKRRETRDTRREDREKRRRDRPRDGERRVSITAPPSISLDSSPSTVDPTGTMAPLEREVAVLRQRASLADSERRRYKEERKWALSQGNKARASQISWQIKRYAALMESFNKEADTKLIQASKSRDGAGPSTSRDVVVTVGGGHTARAPRPDIRVEVRK